MADDTSSGVTPDVDGLRAQLLAAQADAASAKARIKELNDESKGHRLNADNHRKAAEDAAKARDDAIAEAGRVRAEIEAATAAKVKEAETKATEATTRAVQRVIRSDLRAAARDAGARDAADVLALLDMDKVKHSADGDVENAADLMAELKKSKPWMFGQQSSSSTASPPPKDTTKKNSARDMTDDEWKATRARIRRGETV